RQQAREAERVAEEGPGGDEVTQAEGREPADYVEPGEAFVDRAGEVWRHPRILTRRRAKLETGGAAASTAFVAPRQARPSIFASRSSSEGFSPSTRKSCAGRLLLRRATSATRSGGRLSFGCSTVISSENIGRSFSLHGHARSTVKARGPVGRVQDHSFA